VTTQYLQARGGMEAVEGDELLRRVKKGEVTVLDVRPPEEYRAAHIPGAISIPVDELKKRLKELPRGREVVAYCRGPYCVMASRPSRSSARRASRRSAWRRESSTGVPGAGTSRPGTKEHVHDRSAGA
jgi:hypothetical protein